jgi:hypothetical protein
MKATSPVMLTPLSVTVGLLIAFLAARVWSNLDHASTGGGDHALPQRQFERRAHHQAGLDGCVRVTRLAAHPQLCQWSNATSSIHKVRLPRRRSPTSYAGQFCTLNDIFGMW